jgi:hypothetical protein
MLKRTGPIVFSAAKKVDSAQYSRVVAIYNRLVQARGDFRYPVPIFNLSKEEKSCAYMDYEQLEIKLEEKALGVCNTFGTNSEAAIAFLLGHELTHYYEKHGWRKGFADDYKDLKIGIQLDKIADDAANETEADYLGGFLAYSAGFGLFDKGADVIQSLYKAYGLKTDIPGYPSLSDRQALSTRSAEKMNRLVQVFDMANLLTAIGKYPEAYDYYRYIAVEYQSREVYNNLGVTAMMDALQRFTENELKFRFPIELDLESSASKGKDNAQVRTALLKEAILQFDAAISLDPSYAPSYLNKAIAYALLGDTERARFYANVEARQPATAKPYPKILLDIDVLLGILEANGGNAKKAKTLFQSSANAGSEIAKINLKILLKQPVNAANANTSSFAKSEKIDGLEISDIVANPKFIEKYTVEISNELKFLQNPKIGKFSNLYINQNTSNRQLNFILFTAPGYGEKTAQNIGIGADRATIVKAYGDPQRTLETTRGQILVYGKLLFILGADGKLQRWANYQ